jgi:hypothetical protein
MLVTFATCWYALSSKFPADTYLRWMRHLLLEINSFYLVLFTDAAGEALLREHFASYYFANPHLKIVQKPIEEWYNYRYKAQWISNHTKNSALNSRTEWKLNMLWAEKTHFVNEARVKQYFPPTEFYGWCDIGYFREGPCPTFAGTTRLRALNKNKIYYACVDAKQLAALQEIVLRKNTQGLPVAPIPADQTSIAGGFFIAHQSKIESWKNTFDKKLALYFQHGYLVKDDQIIIVDCILSEPHRFEIIQEPDAKENAWFYFRRFLSGG